MMQARRAERYPKAVVQLVVKLIDPQPGHSVYDPTCGSGGMLVESADHIATLLNGLLLGNKPNVLLYGQEKNLGHMGHRQAEPLLAQYACRN
jgi:type I restriction-modification system DNA methylase subunit